MTDDPNLSGLPPAPTPGVLQPTEPVPFALLKSAELKSGGKASRRYTEAEGTRTGLVVGDGYHLIESLFGREMNLISN